MPKINHSEKTGHPCAPRTVAAPSSGIKSPTRARDPIKNYCGLFRGKFPSRKVGRMVYWESLLERDAVSLFEFSPGVANFREQPYTIHYTLNGRTRRYTPDFEITLITGEVWIVEVKPAVRLEKQEERLRFARIKEYFSERSLPFHMLTDQMIRQPILLQNLRILGRYRTAAMTVFERRCWRECLREFHTISFANAAALIGKIDDVWQLIDQRLFSVDLLKNITNDTLLTIELGEFNDEKLYF